MIKIPYVSSPFNACALACYTMTAKYYFPETTFEQIAKISDWSPDYVVWPFNFWLWIMNKGIKITDYDIIDYSGWAKKGIVSLKKSLSQKEYQWLIDNSKDLASLQKQITTVLNHKNFIHKKEKPTFSDLITAFSKQNVCEIVLDSGALDKKDWFSLHRVVITDITDKDIIFHDPRKIPQVNRQEDINHFKKAWLVAVDDPELCIYSKS